MKYETVCTANSSIVAFPKNGQLTEMLRVTDGGQVLFNYRVWEINTATDLFFRTLAVQSPELCRTVLPDLNAKLKACEADHETLTHDVTFWRNNNALLMHTNENLSRTTSGAGAMLWLALGVIVGSLVTAWVVSHLRD